MSLSNRFGIYYFFFLRIVNPLKHSIYKVLISNIPYSASVQNITNIIGSISHVVKAEFKAELLISKSRSILVSFDSEDDAVQAVDSINEMQFEGNKISCIIQQNNSNKKHVLYSKTILIKNQSKMYQPFPNSQNSIINIQNRTKIKKSSSNKIYTTESFD